MTPAQSAAKLQRLLMEDAQLCLKLGMSAREWQGRVRLLLLYSLPPDLVEHRQDEAGEWYHKVKEE